MIRLTTAAITLALACSAVAQTADPNLTFDVATVKPAPPPTSADGKRMIRMGPSGGPGTSDPGQINYQFMNLHQLIVLAYGVKNYQVTGPSSIDSDRFEITAKVPRGATKDDVKIMLQNLLRDRFGLKIHHDEKEMSVYGLVAAKNGSKLKESADQSDPSAAPPTPPPSDGGPSATAGPPAPPDPGAIKRGPDGMPILPKGRPGGIMAAMVMTPNGARMKLSGQQIQLSQLADSLSSQLDKPAVDLSGLNKRYDIALDFAPDMGAMQAKGGMMLGPGPGGPMGGGGGAAVSGVGEQHPGGRDADPSVDAANLFTALQEQLGLKLEPRKAKVDLIVVDSSNKSPTEN